MQRVKERREKKRMWNNDKNILQMDCIYKKWNIIVDLFPRGKKLMLSNDSVSSNNMDLKQDRYATWKFVD